MKYELRKMKAEGGLIVEYVRLFDDQNRRGAGGSALGIWRFTPTQQAAIRAGLPI